MKTRAPLALLPFLIASACTPVEYEDHWMDSPSTEDPSLSDPSYLVSTRIASPTDEQKNTPVVIAAHGFGSATGEWEDFRAYAEERGVLVSNVLLGGHGRSTDAWLETDRHDWGRPMVDEYRALHDKGYTRISFAMLSTSAALWVQQMIDGDYDDFTAPEHLFFVSPFIVSYDARLYIAPVIGPILNNVPSNNNEWEKERFYTNRPHPIFPSLMDALNTAAGRLDGEGITLPDETSAHVWYAEGETTIHADGITKLENGVTGGAEPIETIRMDSNWHSWIRGTGRPRTEDEALAENADGTPRVYTDEDDVMREEQFDYMLGLLLD